MALARTGGTARVNVLSVDSGSSSLKYAVHAVDAAGEVERTRGTRSGDARVGDVVEELARAGFPDIDAVGHRIVFGGPDFIEPVIVSDAVLDSLARLQAVDPLHLAPQIAIVRETQRLLPDVPNVACFDTAFHHAMPSLAACVPLPPDIGPFVRRYGYHGLSYEYIVETLGADARGRSIIAHLGNGASLAAVRDGQPVDTTMGMTPLGGLVMSTRPGDLDPGVLLYLIEGGYTAPALTDMLYRRSGLLAVSEATGDMRELEAGVVDDPRAAFALDLFVYQVCKHAGALAATLGGLDRFVFTGGIGEHSEAIRSRVTEGLRHLGDFKTLVIPTDENRMIARHTYRVFAAPARRDDGL